MTSMTPEYTAGLRAKWKSEGRCIVCSLPAVPGHSTCSRCLESSRTKQARYRQRVRQDVLSAYGGRCACCRSEKELHLDHKNGGGQAHRKSVGGTSTSVYRDVIKRGFPQEFQLLCKPCNYAKSAGSHCPIHLEFDIDCVLLSDGVL